MSSREDTHRLLDAIPGNRLLVIEQVLRASLDTGLPAPPRQFTSTGTLSAEHDLAERSEDIVHEDSVRPD